MRDKLFHQAISEIDWSVGQILDALKKNGLDENTVVIFTSDNGPAVGAVGNAKPLSGTKGTTWEGGMRVPIAERLRSYAINFQEELSRNIRPAGVVMNPKPLTK